MAEEPKKTKEELQKIKAETKKVEAEIKKIEAQTEEAGHAARQWARPRPATSGSRVRS